MIHKMQNTRPRVDLGERSPYLQRKIAHHCLISNREGLGTSLLIMRLAAIDPHSLKVQTELYKIPKFGVNQATFD